MFWSCVVYVPESKPHSWPWLMYRLREGGERGEAFTLHAADWQKKERKREKWCSLAAAGRGSEGLNARCGSSRRTRSFDGIKRSGWGQILKVNGWPCLQFSIPAFPWGSGSRAVLNIWPHTLCFIPWKKRVRCQPPGQALNPSLCTPGSLIMQFGRCFTENRNIPRSIDR